MTESDASLTDFRKMFGDELFNHVEDTVNLIFRADPVFGREAIKGDARYWILAKVIHDAVYVFQACLVPTEPG